MIDLSVFGSLYVAAMGTVWQVSYFFIEIAKYVYHYQDHVKQKEI